MYCHSSLHKHNYNVAKHNKTQCVCDSYMLLNTSLSSEEPYTYIMIYHKAITLLVLAVKLSNCFSPNVDIRHSGSREEYTSKNQSGRQLVLACFLLG